MSMTLRVKIVFILLIVVGGLLIVLSAISIVRFFQNRGEEPVAQVPTDEPEKGSGADVISSEAGLDSAPPQPPAVRAGNEIISMVVPFVERFGSYSNQGNFENLSDLLPFMSSSMRSWAEKRVAEQREQPFQELYRGVTTKALSYALSSYEPEEGRAEMQVSTQRRELIGSTVNARVYNQDIVVKLVKDDGAWVVDSAFWQ